MNEASSQKFQPDIMRLNFLEPLFAGKVGAPDGQRFEHGALERAPVEVE